MRKNEPATTEEALDVNRGGCGKNKYEWHEFNTIDAPGMER
jgi:hypothetical protein